MPLPRALWRDFQNFRGGGAAKTRANPATSEIANTEHKIDFICIILRSTFNFIPNMFICKEIFDIIVRAFNRIFVSKPHLLGLQDGNFLTEECIFVRQMRR
jgi:hypothetical protein